MKERSEKDRARLTGELYAPLPGQYIQPDDDDIEVGPWSKAEMAASFRALQTEFGGRAR